MKPIKTAGGFTLFVSITYILVKLTIFGSFIKFRIVYPYDEKGHIEVKLCKKEKHIVCPSFLKDYYEIKNNTKMPMLRIMLVFTSLKVKRKLQGTTIILYFYLVTLFSASELNVCCYLSFKSHKSCCKWSHSCNHYFLFVCEKNVRSGESVLHLTYNGQSSLTRWGKIEFLRLIFKIDGRIFINEHLENTLGPVIQR